MLRTFGRSRSTRLAMLSAAGMLLSVVTVAAPSAVGAAGATAAADVMQLGSVPMGSNTMLSAGIYNSSGQLVRHLYELAPRSGTAYLSWDGKDDGGNEVPPGNYNWRALTSSVKGSDQGGIGVGGTPQPGQAFDTVREPGDTSAVAYGPSGDLFVSSTYEELDGASVYRYSPANLPTGVQTWASNDGFQLQSHALAVDGQYVYVAAHADYDKTLGDWVHYGIFRLDAATGARVGWPGLDHITISDWRTGVGDTPVTGVAVDAQYIWVVDGADNQIKVFNKSDGTPAPILGGQNSMPVTGPRGIVTDGADRFWITTPTGVQRYFYDAASGSMRLEAQIPGLDHPYGLAWDRSNGASILYVSEIGTGQVHKYDVSGAMPVSLTSWFGNMPAGGRVTDTAFGWEYDSRSKVPGGDAAIAVSPDGKTLSVVDIWNGRTMFYNTASGTPLSYKLQGTPIPTPDIDPVPTPAAGPPADVTSMGREYVVDYSTLDAAGQHPWTLKDNWFPPDNTSGLINPQGTAIRVFNGVEYLYVYVSARCPYGGCGTMTPGPMPYGGILIYRLNTQGTGAGMQQVAELKRDTASGAPRWKYDVGGTTLEFITDTNGDGVLGDSGDADDTTNVKGYFPGDPSTWVDGQGTIWLANGGSYDQASDTLTEGIASIPLHGFDAHGNPVYQTSDFKVTVPTEGDRANNAYLPSGEQVRYDTVNQRVFAEVDTGEFNQEANFGGNGVLMQDLKTGQRSVFSGYSPLDGSRDTLRDSVTALAVDNSTDGFFYTGSSTGAGQRISMYTWDGMLVSRANSNIPVWNPGIFDQGMSLAAFRNSDGTHYVYTEDDGYGRTGLFSFTNADANGATQRFGSNPQTGDHSGDFTWTGSVTSSNLVAWWQFDQARGLFAPDASGGDHYGIVEENGSVSPWQPAGGVHNGAITFDGTNVTGVQLRKATWSANQDDLIDNPSYQSAMTFTSWIKTTGSGVVIGYQDTTTVESSLPSPSQSVPMMYVGTDGHLYGDTLTAAGCAKPQVVYPGKVNDGQWHHVALAVSPTGQTLYVDGVAADSTSCAMAYAGLGFTSLATGYTTKGSGSTATNWPATPGGYFHFVGSLDDTRIYRTTLAAADIQSMAEPQTPPGPLADYPLDHTSNTIASDDSEHGKDGTIVNGVWSPDGYLTFGSNPVKPTLVKLPQDLADHAPMSFSIWVNTTKGGPIFGDQRGDYPAPEVAGFSGAGVGPMTAEDLSIGADGMVHSSLMNLPMQSYTTSPQPGFAAVAPLTDGQWHNITVTATTSGGPSPTFTVCLYVNGALANRQTSVQGIWAMMRPNDQLGAGRDTNAAWEYFNGDMSGLEVWTRALDPQEIATMVNPGNPGI